MTVEIHQHIGRPIIIGGGLAGLMVALSLAPEPVLLLSRTPLGTEASSLWAQGGLAASLGSDDDPALHLADTLAAGAGLCDAEIANRFVSAAPKAVDDLLRRGVRFDRAADGALLLGLEAAHSRRRILHAAGDGTGREIMRALIEAVRRTRSITLLEGVEARRLIIENGAVAGVLAAGAHDSVLIASQRVVIASGGIGGLFQQTTNPYGSFGQGLALAARAGAQLADLEFIQFHPTALDGPSRPMKLISEAVRGEGAVLVDETGERFLAGEPAAELAPRDVVARGIWRHLAKGHRVYLDARQRPGPLFARRFPAIASLCRAEGVDPETELIPVQPAAHYHMGGIAVDEAGRSSVSGLWACGEAACTGLHGANRLASNSLMEAVVSAGWVAGSIAGTPSGHRRILAPGALPPAPDSSAIRLILSRRIGILHDRDGLEEAATLLLPSAVDEGQASDPAIVGLMITIAALGRQESRGAHYRADFPQAAQVARRSVLCLDEALTIARELSSHPIQLARSA